MWKLLVLEDDPAFAEAMHHQIGTRLADRAELSIVADVASTRAALKAALPDLIVLDVSVPLSPGGRVDPRGGLKLLAELPEIAPGIPILVLSGQDRRQAVELLLSRRVDAYAFKDDGLDEAHAQLERMLASLELKRSHRLLREVVDRSAAPPLVARCAPMRDLVARADQVALRETTVLITGESGTGKEVLARAIHARSPRAPGPFVALSCAALPEGLAEAELFGAARGAYTGLDHAREGVMGQARGGTLFLDEIGELPLALQPKLLRALQERTFRPLGAAGEERADFRLICATHRDLVQMAQQGRFREDLLFRIRVFPLQLPPLRERLEDLPFLVEYLVDRFNREMGRRITGLTDAARSLLARHTWPGNVRELANVIEYAFVLETETSIRPANLPALHRPAAVDADLALGHAEATEAFEQRYLLAALERSGWHIGRTADAVGLPRRTLQERMARLGIRIRPPGPRDEASSRGRPR
jgi:two-component system response regulator HydG